MATTLINSGHDVEESQLEPEDVLHEHGQTEQADRHELVFAMFNITTSLSWFINDMWGVELIAPIRIVQSEATFIGPEGLNLPGFGSIHHRDETLVGISDTTLQTRLSHATPLDTGGRLSGSFYLGISLPTGKIEPNPDALGRAGLNHQHIFFGRGTFAPISGGNIALTQTNFGIEAWFNAIFPFYENEFGYRANRDIAGGFAFTHSLGLDDWDFGILADAYRNSTALWEGEPQRNSGRTDFILGSRFTWRWAESSLATLEFKRPVYTEANGGQLAIPLMVSLSLGHSIL